MKLYQTILFCWVKLMGSFVHSSSNSLPSVLCVWKPRRMYRFHWNRVAVLRYLSRKNGRGVETKSLEPVGEALTGASSHLSVAIQNRGLSRSGDPERLGATAESMTSVMVDGSRDNLLSESVKNGRRTVRYLRVLI